MSYVSEGERERFNALLARAAAEDSRRLHAEPRDMDLPPREQARTLAPAERHSPGRPDPAPAGDSPTPDDAPALVVVAAKA